MRNEAPARFKKRRLWPECSPQLVRQESLVPRQTPLVFLPLILIAIARAALVLFIRAGSPSALRWLAVRVQRQ